MFKLKCESSNSNLCPCAICTQGAQLPRQANLQPRENPGCSQNRTSTCRRAGAEGIGAGHPASRPVRGCLSAACPTPSPLPTSQKRGFLSLLPLRVAYCGQGGGTQHLRGKLHEETSHFLAALCLLLLDRTCEVMRPRTVAATMTMTSALVSFIF